MSAMSNPFVVVVITGASSGIGRAVAVELSRRGGYRLVLAARRLDALREAVAECGGDEVAHAVPADVTRRADVKALLAAAAERWGRVDVLVNNAGRGCSVLPSALTDDVLDDMMTVNVKSALYGMQEVLPYFAKNEGNKGLIVNTSSLLGRVAMPNPFALERSAYTMSKHALSALTDLFRVEMQREGSPTRGAVTVSLFLPGIVGTDFGLAAGGADSRSLPIAQPVEEVAAILVDECIVRRRVDVYSKGEEYKAVVNADIATKHAA